VLVLVVVLVLDPLGFWRGKGNPIPPDGFVHFNRSDGETSAFSGRSRSTSPDFGICINCRSNASHLLRSRPAQITALVITLIAAASAYPVLVSGQRAYKTIRGIADDTGAEALDDHMDRAEKTIGLFYVLALVALAGLLVPIKWPKTGLPLTATTLVFALVCFGLSLYIAQVGGRVRHPEFRPAEPGETPTRPRLTRQIPK
jgi:hypothetical protein